MKKNHWFGIFHDIYINCLKYDNMFFERFLNFLAGIGVQYESDWTKTFQRGFKVTPRPVVGDTRYISVWVS